MDNQQNLPDHALDLLNYLNSNGSATQKELIGSLSLPIRAIRYAIRRLKEEQFIVSKPDLLDMRSLRYDINSQYAETINELLNDKQNSSQTIAE